MIDLWNDRRWTEQSVVNSLLVSLCVNVTTCFFCFSVYVACCSHHAGASPGGLQLFEEVLQLLPFDVTVSCGAAEATKLVWHKWCCEAFKSPGALLTVQKFD